MGIYRDLFFNNINGFITNNFPVLRKLYTDEKWNQLVRDFFRSHEAHTPLFPELPREFLQFIEDQRGPEAGDPPFILELAHYEWAELALSLDSADIADEEFDAQGDLLAHPLVPSPVAWQFSYQFPVHRIRPDYQPAEAPAEPTHLIIYRTSSDEVRFMEVNVVTARLLQLITENPEASGLELLSDIASELQQPLDAIKVHGLKILEDLRQREIILGTRPQQ